MAKIKKVPESETTYQLQFMCPGCGYTHAVHDKSFGSNGWEFNGDYDKPTFSPSVRSIGEVKLCHSFIKDGKIQFLSDCEHELKNQTVELPEIN